MNTRLDAINDMLAVNGEAPVTSEDSNDPAAVQASRKLNKISRTIQSRGWWFNTEVMTLNHSTGTGDVVVPQNALSVDPVDADSTLVKRGNRLYDKEKNTYNIGEGVKCNMVLQLPVGDLPQQAYDYIVAKAIADYYRDDDGDVQKVRDLREDVNETFAYLQREHLANADVNIMHSPLGNELASKTHTGRKTRFTK